jgi:hypothetical protein
MKAAVIILMPPLVVTSQALASLQHLAATLKVATALLPVVGRRRAYAARLFGAWQR